MISNLRGSSSSSSLIYAKWGATAITSALIHIALLFLLLLSSAYLIRHPDLTNTKQIYLQLISKDLNPFEIKQRVKFRPTTILNPANLPTKVPPYSKFLPKLQMAQKPDSASGGLNWVGAKRSDLDVALSYGDGLLKHVEGIPSVDSLSNVVYENRNSINFEPKTVESSKTPMLSTIHPPKIKHNSHQFSVQIKDASEVSLEISKLSNLERISSQLVQLVNEESAKKVDLVFILDTSQSMTDKIKSTVRQLKGMAEKLSQGDVDFTLGLVKFHDGFGYQTMGWDVSISPQSKDLEKIVDLLESIRCRGDERALDALVEAASKVKFRPEAQKRFIFITDEYVKGSYSGAEVLNRLKSMGIKVDVIGLDEPFQKAVAEQTGGIWMPIN